MRRNQEHALKRDPGRQNVHQGPKMCDAISDPSLVIRLRRRGREQVIVFTRYRDDENVVECRIRKKLNNGRGVGRRVSEETKHPAVNLLESGELREKRICVTGREQSSRFHLSRNPSTQLFFQNLLEGVKVQDRHIEAELVTYARLLPRDHKNETRVFTTKQHSTTYVSGSNEHGIVLRDKSRWFSSAITVDFM